MKLQVSMDFMERMSTAISNFVKYREALGLSIPRSVRDIYQNDLTDQFQEMSGFSDREMMQFQWSDDLFGLSKFSGGRYEH